MATEAEWSCPICQDTQSDVVSALPCHHQFCLACILRWAKTNPVYPLCSSPQRLSGFLSRVDRTTYNLPSAPLKSHQRPTARQEYLPSALPKIASMVFPCLLHSSHGPFMSPPSCPQRTLSPAEQGAAGPQPVGGLLPEVWAGLLQQQQHLLDPVRPWLYQRLTEIYGDQWRRAEAAEASILHRLCAHGPDADALVEVLQPLLSGHTALLVHGIISTTMDQCSKEAQSLLCFCHAREADRLLASASSSSCTSSQERTPATGSVRFNMEEEAGMSQASLQRNHSCPQPVPDTAEWDQPQEESEQAAVAGLSAQNGICRHSTADQGRDHSLRDSQCDKKRRAPRSQDSL